MNGVDTRSRLSQVAARAGVRSGHRAANSWSRGITSRISGLSALATSYWDDPNRIAPRQRQRQETQCRSNYDMGEIAYDTFAPRLQSPFNVVGLSGLDLVGVYVSSLMIVPI